MRKWVEPLPLIHYVKKLREAGAPETQAEAQVEALAEIIQGDLITKRYFNHHLRELEYRLIIKLGAMIAASIAITVSLVKLL